MSFVRTLAALVLLGTAVADDLYVPIHKRFSYHASIDDFSYLSMLSKRDTCSDAFGSGAHNSNCAPDATLCCTRDGQDYPSCEKWLSKGWCCVGRKDNDKCYVDQESVCDEDSAVACTKLATGIAKACCPKMTTCDESLAASESLVRCNINRGDLIVANAATNSKSLTAPVSSATEASSTTSDPTASNVTETEIASETPTDNSRMVSGSVIGGIVAGALACVAIIAGVLFWLFRRHRNDAAVNQTLPQSSIQQDSYEQQMKNGQQPQRYYSDSGQNSAYTYPSWPPPAELMEQRAPVELDSTTARVR